MLFRSMTALKEEIESAVAEGVEMLPLQAPVSIEVDASGACTALLMQPQMISAYSRGRPGVVNAQKPVERLEADLIVAAVGQDVVSSTFEDFGMKTHWGAFTTDEFLAAEGFSMFLSAATAKAVPPPSSKPWAPARSPPATLMKCSAFTITSTAAFRRRLRA